MVFYALTSERVKQGFDNHRGLKHVNVTVKHVSSL